MLYWPLTILILHMAIIIIFFVETLESLWILYRLTGEKKYQDQAWEIFQVMIAECSDVKKNNLEYINL